MPPINEAIRACVYAIRVLIGFVVFRIANQTPAFAHRGMVGLFCLTSGRSNDVISHAIGRLKPPYAFEDARGILGDMSSAKYREPIVSNLRARGFYVFENCLPKDLCDRLLRYAVSQPCKLRAMNGERQSAIVSAVYPRGAPKAVRYEFDMQELLANQDVQKLLADLSFAALAQHYLKARPIVDVLGMWWHTDYSKIPDSEAAQYFHFDMDRPKWLKFFIYLTDVNTENGPHTFVAGSHRTGRMPSNLLRKGYARLQDAEVTEAFNDSDIIEFAAPRGTIIAEDTRGLHKGKLVEAGDRLVLQIQFSNSLFGAIYPKAKLMRELSPELRDASRRYPALYAAYLDSAT